MREKVRVAIRGLLFLGLAVLPGLFSGPDSGLSPYLSALSPLAAMHAYAAPNKCQNKGCVAGGHRHSNCGHLEGSNCRNLSGSCSVTSC